MVIKMYGSFYTSRHVASSHLAISGISRDGILKVVVTFVGEKSRGLLLDGWRKYSI
jgi:hypothetical protein